MFREIPPDTRRWSIDAAQIYEALIEARQIRREKFNGSVRFAPRNGVDYLLRKVRQREKSLGRRSPETETIYEQFVSGRKRNQDMIDGLDARLEKMAPVVRAYGLGRVPVIAARLLRRMESLGLLGGALHVIGTNAIFAYEAKTGVHFGTELMATEDMDLLFDTRRRLSVSASADVNFLGILQSVDSTFAMRQSGSFRAVNAAGYHVDLIRSMPADVMRDKSHGFVARERQDPSSDMEAIQIAGLAWLENAPKFEAVAMAEDGFPVRIQTVDPRIFAAHKLWLSEQPDRDPLKRRRDRAQAMAVHDLASRYLALGFDDPVVAKMPKPLARLAIEQWGGHLPSEGRKEGGYVRAGIMDRAHGPGPDGRKDAFDGLAVRRCTRCPAGRDRRRAGFAVSGHVFDRLGSFAAVFSSRSAGQPIAASAAARPGDIRNSASSFFIAGWTDLDSLFNTLTLVCHRRRRRRVPGRNSSIAFRKPGAQSPGPASSGRAAVRASSARSREPRAESRSTASCPPGSPRPAPACIRHCPPSAPGDGRRRPGHGNGRGPGGRAFASARVRPAIPDRRF